MKPARKPDRKAQERLRQAAWDVGAAHPAPPPADRVLLAVVQPRQGFVAWGLAGPGPGAAKVRVHDVTDLAFDGRNSHSHSDLDAPRTEGRSYFSVPRAGRTHVAELGRLQPDGSFKVLARSAAVVFDRDRPSADYRLDGLFVSRALPEPIPVDSVLDAPVYERLERALTRPGRRRAAVAAVLCPAPPGAGEDAVGALAAGVAGRIGRFGVQARVFQAREPGGKRQAGDLVRRADTAAAALLRKIDAAPGRKSFRLVHAHDWPVAGAGARLAKRLKVPFVLSLHSTERERAGDSPLSAASAEIAGRERAAVAAADLVLVPSPATRQQVLDGGDVAPERVVVVPWGRPSGPAPVDGSAVLRGLGLPPGAKAALFCGEISHAAGADLLVEAMPAVCKDVPNAHVVLAGDGPLRGELEQRARDLGVGARCRFAGHLSRTAFESLLAACDFLVIPARTAQDSRPALAALERGKPVLVTHQAQVPCVAHGRNGLVTYDNPGSIVWGVKELLHRPPRDFAGRSGQVHGAPTAVSLESVAVRHAVHYLSLLGEDVDA